MLDRAEWDNGQTLPPADFYRTEHQLIYQVMVSQAEANRPTDVVTLMDALNSLGEPMPPEASMILVSLLATHGAPPIFLLMPTLFASAPF